MQHSRSRHAFSTHLLYVTNGSCFQIWRFTKNLQQVARFFGDLGGTGARIFVEGRPPGPRLEPPLQQWT